MPLPSTSAYASTVSVGHASAAPQPAHLDEKPELADLRRFLRHKVRRVVRTARADEQPTLSAVLRDHLGDINTEQPVVVESWPAYEQVNVQAGIEAWLTSPGLSSRLVGVVNFRHRSFGLAELLSPHDGPYDDHHGVRPGNVARANVACGPDGQTRPCVQCGLYLVSDGDRRTALFIRGADPESGRTGIGLQVVSTDPSFAQHAASEIRRLALELNVFRGQVLSFTREVFGHGEALLHFHSRPSMNASELVLDDQTLGAVTQQVVAVARHRERLLAAGQHLKRGLLLYGPPGVGKTHTIRYLISSLTETTVVQLSGNALGFVAEACSVARALQPAMVVIEDVDLIAEERGARGGHNPMLFQLLNEMDGLAEDSDVVFILTTNRADLLEPALAARPGRVDQAVQLTLPDRKARRELFELYRGTLDVDEAGLPEVLDRTDGVTASFLKELLRRAAVRTADHAAEPGRLRVTADDLRAALDELLDVRNAMTRTVLGSAEPSTMTA